MNYIVNNFKLLKFIFTNLIKNILAILLILAFPFIFVAMFCIFFKISFSSSFSYVFGAYSIIVTIILFDYILVSRLEEANFYNSSDETIKIKDSLKFVKDLMMSDMKIPVKLWDDNVSNLDTYNKLLRGNDKLHLYDKRNDFEYLIRKLYVIDGFDFIYDDSDNTLDFSKLTRRDRSFASECNSILAGLIKHLEMKLGVDKK